jgi:hypothetical protein
LRGVSNAGDIKDGAEVIAFVFNASNPGMKFVKAKTDLMISLWHGKKDPSDHLWHERNECHTVLTLLASEARTVVNAVVAAVR